MNKILLIASSIFLFSSLQLNNNNKSMPENGIIKGGENLTYVASYKMAGLMTDIAQVKMTTSKVSTKTKDFFHLKATAATYSRWDSFFRIRDLYESYVDTKTLKPSLYNRNIEEGSYRKKVKYKFKRSKGIAKTTITKRRGDGTDWVRNFDSKIGSNTFDLVSAIYNARTFEYATFQVGKVIPMNIIMDGEQLIAYVKYLGTDTINMGKFGNKECYKLSLSFAEGDFDKAKGTKNMWITADNQRLIALIKAKIPLGTVQIRLTDI